MRMPWDRGHPDTDYDRRRRDPLGATAPRGAQGYGDADTNDSDMGPPGGSWGNRETREINAPQPRRARPGAWGREEWDRGEWDEDRYGYPEATSYGREMHRAGRGYAPEGRFAERDAGYRDEARSHWPSPWRDPRELQPRGQRAAPDAGSGYGYRDERRGGDDTGRRGAEHWTGGTREEFGRFEGAFDRRDAGPPRRRWQAEHGPKGYTRSDERIRDDICECLYHEPGLDVREVGVRVENGVVTLEGTVPERHMKHRIEDLCDGRFGVRDVDNRIRVERVADAVRGAQRETGGDGERRSAESARPH